MKKNLLKETTGVPRPILFWVDHFSEIIIDLLEEMIIDDDFTEFPMTYINSDGDEVKESAYGVGYDITSDYSKKRILKKLNHTSIDDLVQDPKFRGFPLLDFETSLDLVLVPDEVYDIEFKKTPYDSVEGSHASYTGDEMIGNINGVDVFINQIFTFKIYLPVSVKNNFNKNQIKSYIRPVINHELLHAYETYRRYLLNEDPFQGQETFLNMALNVINPKIKNDLNHFFYLLYLHLYFEMNARISQLYQEMIERGVSNKEEFLNVLYNSKSWQEANSLIDFDAEKYLNTLNIEEVKKFTKDWDVTLQILNAKIKQQGVYKGKYMEPVPAKAKENPYFFFKFFEKRFKEKGESFKRKAYRLYDIVTNPSVMTENLQQEINCTACGHSWEVEPGDDNPYLCHMCGYDVLEKKYNKEELNDFWANRLVEKWSKKYKKSINCSNPKGFSQKAHCAARRKRKAGQKTKSKSPFN